MVCQVNQERSIKVRNTISDHYKSLEEYFDFQYMPSFISFIFFPKLYKKVKHPNMINISAEIDQVAYL